MNKTIFRKYFDLLMKSYITLLICLLDSWCTSKLFVETLTFFWLSRIFVFHNSLISRGQFLEKNKSTDGRKHANTMVTKGD